MMMQEEEGTCWRSRVSSKCLCHAKVLTILKFNVNTKCTAQINHENVEKYMKIIINIESNQKIARFRYFQQNLTRFYR